VAVALKNDKRTVFGWAMYDWANSAYATTSGAIIAPFFTSSMVGDDGVSVFGATLGGTTIWSAVVSIGAMVLFLAMPILGAVADFSAAKRGFLKFFAVLGAVFTALLFVVPDNAWVPFLLIFLVSQIGFVAANVFYDGFLPQITTDDTIDRVSSKGFAFGYVGGGLYLLFGLAYIFIAGDDGGIAPRLVIAGAGVWWFLFSLFSLKRLPEVGESDDLPEEYAGRNRLVSYASVGLARTWATTKKLRAFPQILLFVLAYMFYNDGTQTVINISGAYAEDTLNLEITDVAITFLIVQFVAFGGALLFGVIADRVGAKRAILANLAIWTVLGVAGYFLPEGEAVPLYILGAFVGLVLGGVQALSRSLYATMIPEEAAAEFFGFFSVFSKFSAIWGPLLFALVSGITGSGRPAIAAIVVFFIIGGFLLSRVDIEEAQASRDRWHFDGTEVS
jgi:UMF1 family MFS transporter